MRLGNISGPMPAHDLQYPIGRFVAPTSALKAEERETMISELEAVPAHVRAAVDGLNAEQLDTPYRPGGWTVRQVVHHVPDSHLSGFVRFKLALTEDVPTIKPYHEDRWAELADGKSAFVEQSLGLLDLINVRWLVVLRAMQPSDFARRLNHPEHDRPLSLDTMLALYAWHGKHHVAHITSLRERSGW